MTQIDLQTPISPLSDIRNFNLMDNEMRHQRPTDFTYWTNCKRRPPGSEVEDTWKHLMTPSKDTDH